MANRKRVSRKKKVDDSSVFADAMDSRFTGLNDSSISLMKAEAEEKAKEFIAKLDRIKDDTLSKAEINLNTQLLLLPESLREMPIEFSDNGIKELLGYGTPDAEFSRENIPPETTLKRQQESKTGNGSVQSVKFPDTLKTVCKNANSNFDAFKTPMNRVPVSALAAAEKYTVSKPERPDNCGIRLRRIMKPDEEALSVCGSPLHVQSNIAKPTVSIPLPGGVVVNIEPKKPEGQITVPELDVKTKQQIRLLYDQLHAIL